jgi:hypothetical protein
MKGYLEEMIAGVAAGDEIEYWWSLEERRKTDAVTKEAVIGCVKNLTPPYSWSTYLFDVTAIPYAIVKYGTSIAAKTLGAEIVLSCGKAIVDNWQSNSKECGDIICDYTSSESGSGDRYGNEKSSSDKLSTGSVSIISSGSDSHACYYDRDGNGKCFSNSKK